MQLPPIRGAEGADHPYRPLLQNVDVLLRLPLLVISYRAYEGPKVGL